VRLSRTVWAPLGLVLLVAATGVGFSTGQRERLEKAYASSYVATAQPVKLAPIRPHFTTKEGCRDARSLPIPSCHCSLLRCPLALVVACIGHRQAVKPRPLFGIPDCTVIIKASSIRIAALFRDLVARCRLLRIIQSTPVPLLRRIAYWQTRPGTL
jgi:hypothetical protein